MSPSPQRAKRSFRTGGVLACALLALPAAAAKPAPADEQVLNIAHRGASGLAPEHTFAAYDLALSQGADFIEQDLQQTSDGTLVVLHDETLDRTARGPAENCTGLVATKTLEQIKTCDVGSWFNERYPERAREEYVALRIPTLEEVLRRYRHRANYYIETKSPERASRMEERLVALLGEYHLLRPAQRRWQVLVQSFSPASLLRVRDLAPGLPLVQLFSSRETSASIRARLDTVSDYAVGIGPSKTDVDAALVEAAHARCLDVHPYTLMDDRNEVRALIDLGVDGMFANFPAVLEEMLGKDAVDGKQAAKRAARAHADCVRASDDDRRPRSLTSLTDAAPAPRAADHPAGPHLFGSIIGPSHRAACGRSPYARTQKDGGVTG